MKPLLGPFDPPVFDLGVFDLPFVGAIPIKIHGFGVLVALGFVFGGNIAMARAKKVGQDPEVFNRLIFWLVVGVFVGGHVGYGVMYKPDEYFAHPEKFLQMWEGLSSFGGFAACVPICIWFFRREKLKVWHALDTVAIGLTFGWFLGRMGCFVAHDHPGTVTDFYLGVYGMCPGLSDSTACHDMGLYEGLWSLSMYLLFRHLDKVPRVPGLYPLLLGAVYGPVRFVMDTLRPESTDAHYGGLTPAQYGSIALTILAWALLLRRLRSGQEPEWTLPVDTPSPA